MDVCHHSNSRQFRCICGTENIWWQHGENEQACPNCLRMHRRGPDGPRSSKKAGCKGMEHTNFTAALEDARNAFILSMGRHGFYQEKDGKAVITDTTKKGDDWFETKIDLTEHFIGGRKSKLPGAATSPRRA